MEDVRKYVAAISRTLLEQRQDKGLERIRTALRRQETRRLDPLASIDEDGSASRKNAELAKRNREDGNEAFAAGNFHLASLLYSESLRYSPVNAKDEDNLAAAAAANRSAAFYQLGRYEKCLEDIELALELGYPRVTGYKLLIRKCKCLLELGRISAAQSAFDEAVDAIDRSGMKKDIRKGIAVELQEAFINLANEVKADGASEASEKNKDALPPWCTLKEPHPKYPSASSAISVRYEATVGRHVVATRNIEAGEVIFNEEPIVAVLCPEEDATTESCADCFAYIKDDAPIPCPTCSKVVFCSLKCRRKALESYHVIECALSPVFAATKLDKMPLVVMVLRAIAQKPINFFLENADKFSDHNVKNGVEGDDNQVYRSDDYRNLYNLVTHEEHREPEDVAAKIAFAVFLTRCLASAGYFASVKADDLEAAEERIAAVALQFLQGFQFNTHMIESVYENRLIGQDAETRIWKESAKFAAGEFVETSRLGGAVFPALANMNHSCDPNVVLLNWGKRNVAFANRPIKAGEEIFDTYGPVYYHVDREERRRLLQVTFSSKNSTFISEVCGK